MKRVLGMIDPRCASLFLSNTVGNYIKVNVDDVNCDKMIDSSLNSYRMLVTKQQMLTVIRWLTGQFKQWQDARN